MNLQAEKLSLVQSILNINDRELLMELKTLIKQNEVDWFDNLSNSQKEDVLEGINDADQGRAMSHQEIVKKFGKWGMK
jgi:predicted transcriptional regulator